METRAVTAEDVIRSIRYNEDDLMVVHGMRKVFVEGIAFTIDRPYWIVTTDEDEIIPLSSLRIEK